jgi:hypothetical protein
MRSKICVVLTALSVVLAACGGDDEALVVPGERTFPEGSR